jgi:anti-sigma factor RsiW
MTTCAETTLSLGVYLLGALDPAERAAVDAHLRTCALCRAELADLAELPSLLARLTLEDVVPEPMPVPDDLFERVASQARAEREEPTEPTELARSASGRLVRYRRLVAVAAALAVIAGGGIGAWAALRSHAEVYKSRRQLGSNVQMSVALADQAAGTGYTVTVVGLPNDEHCRLIAVGVDGTRDVAGRWDATYQGQAKETGSTSIPRSQLSRLVLLGTGGERLATVDI